MFDLGSEGVQQYQKCLHSKFCPFSVERGGVIKYYFPPKIKKSAIHSVGRGTQFVTFVMAPLSCS